MVFEVQFSLVGNNRARTDVADASLDLGGGLTVNTAPFGVGVTFECRYPMKVELESSAFNVTEVTVSGTSSGKGNLAGGFALNLDNQSMILGAILTVSADWAVTLNGIEFFFDSYNVKGSVHEVPIIRDGCYSNTLKVSRKDGTAAKQSFSFKTFTIEGETSKEQVIAENLLNIAIHIYNFEVKLLKVYKLVKFTNSVGITIYLGHFLRYPNLQIERLRWKDRPNMPDRRRRL